jgi:predicted 3-demethylubiquinone-9 3-methyltransferase (glyoxalase superfamily)
MSKITPFLWFNDNAEEAINFYCAIFKNARLLSTSRYPESSAVASGRPVGSLMSASFTLDGQEFVALNGGPMYRLSPAISFMIECEMQDEIDYYWDRLGEGSTMQQCGWVTDKFGVTWQIVPTIWSRLISCGDPASVQRVTAAMMKMTKLEIKALEDAAAGRS